MIETEESREREWIVSRFQLLSSSSTPSSSLPSRCEQGTPGEMSLLGLVRERGKVTISSSSGLLLGTDGLNKAGGQNRVKIENEISRE